MSNLLAEVDGNPWIGGLLEDGISLEGHARGQGHAGLRAALEVDPWGVARRHLLVAGEISHTALDAVRRCLVSLAADDLRDKKAADARRLRCWFTVEIPVARVISSESLLSRIIRRLYFQGALAGLNAHPALRQFMVDLRLAYFQTRGVTKLSEQETRTAKANAGVEIGLTDVTAQLGVGDEVTFLAGLEAEMQRLGEADAEDLLDFSVRRLLGLDLKLKDLAGPQAQRYTAALAERAGRWVRRAADLFVTDDKAEAEARRARFAVDLRVVVVLHALDHLPYPELAQLTEHLRNVLVSVPVRFVFAGGLMQELMWHTDQIELVPRLHHLLDHVYIGGPVPAAPPPDGDAQRVASALARWRQALVAEAQARAAERGEDPAAAAAMARAFGGDLERLLAARIRTWRGLGIPSARFTELLRLDRVGPQPAASQTAAKPEVRCVSPLWQSAVDALIAALEQPTP